MPDHTLTLPNCLIEDAQDEYPNRDNGSALWTSQQQRRLPASGFLPWWCGGVRLCPGSKNFEQCVRLILSLLLSLIPSPVRKICIPQSCLLGFHVVIGYVSAVRLLPFAECRAL